jgi:hypothetical protein
MSPRLPFNFGPDFWREATFRHRLSPEVLG